jgi:hypothetical protein
MPNPTLILSYTCGGFLFLYVLLVGMTMYFASAETHFTRETRDTESVVGTLEEAYYDAIAVVHAQDPLSIGFVSPQHVVYITSGAEVLSLGQTKVKP